MPPIHVISGLSADEPDYPVSDDRTLTALVAAEDGHFWQRTRNRVITDRLADLGVRSGARILELGCGTGCVAAAMHRAGLSVTGVDGHYSRLAVAHRREPEVRLWQHDLRRGVCELPETGFDAAGLFDVIEHLDDPAAALTSALSCVRPDAPVVGTVPALMSLWSTIDEDSGHKIRYSEATLRALLERIPGARVIEVAPFFRALVPLLWVQRQFVGRGRGAADAEANLSVPPKLINGTLGALVLAEHRGRAWLDRAGIPGASLWFALRRAA